MVDRRNTLKTRPQLARLDSLGTSFDADSIFSDKESAEPLSVSQIAERIVKVQGAGV